MKVNATGVLSVEAVCITMPLCKPLYYVYQYMINVWQLVAEGAFRCVLLRHVFLLSSWWIVIRSDCWKIYVAYLTTASYRNVTEWTEETFCVLQVQLCSLTNINHQPIYTFPNISEGSFRSFSVGCLLPMNFYVCNVEEKGMICIDSRHW